MTFRTGLLKRDWEEVQVKTFGRWCAKFLKQRGIPFEDLCTEFKNGTKLCQLLEIIGKQTLPKKWWPQPKNRYQELENVDASLSFIEERGVKLVATHKEQIVDGDKKMTLGLIWSLISKFAIDDISVEEKTARDALLIWCKKNTAGYEGVEMKNFSSSWVNGLAWCALINKFRPQELDYSSLDTASTDKSVWLANTQRAWEVFRKLGIETLLDPEDCVGPLEDTAFTPDDKSIITQVTELYHYFSAETKQQTMADKLKRAIQIQRQVEEFKSRYEEEARATIAAIDAAYAMLTADDYERTVLGVRGKLAEAIGYTRDQRPDIVEKRATALRTWGTLLTKCKTTGRVVPTVEPGLEPEALTAKFQQIEETSGTRRAELTTELKELEQALIDAFDARCQEVFDAARDILGRADSLEGDLQQKWEALQGMLQEALAEKEKADALEGPNTELVSLGLNTRAKYTMFQVQTEVDILVTHLKHLIEQNEGAQFEARNQARIDAYNAAAAPVLQEAKEFQASVSEVTGNLVERRTALLAKQEELTVKREAAQFLVPMFQELEKDGIHLDIAITPGKINGIYGGILNKIVEELHIIYKEMVENFDAHTSAIMEKCKGVTARADSAAGAPEEVRDQYVAFISEGEQIEPEIPPLDPEFEELTQFHLNFKAKYTPVDVRSEYGQMIAHLKHLLQSKEGEIALADRNYRTSQYTEAAAVVVAESQQLEKEIDSIASHETGMEEKRGEYEAVRGVVLAFDAKIEQLVPAYADLEARQIHFEIEHSPASIRAFVNGLDAHVVTLIQELDQAIAAAKGLEISEEQLAEFRETFSFFDKDGNKLLEPFQLEACLTALGEPVKENECKEIIAKYMGGGSGGIDFDNYVRFMLDRFSRVETAQSTKEAFQALSQDNPVINDEQIDRWFQADDASYLRGQLQHNESGYEFEPWVDKIYA